MKLPRWLLICLWTSIGLAVLVAAGWWWVTWPERTAREYVGLMASGQQQEAERMIDSASGTAPMALFDEPAIPLKVPLTSSPRTFSDILFARQVFRGEGDRWLYLVERGTISSAGPNWSYPLFDWLFDEPEYEPPTEVK